MNSGPVVESVNVSDTTEFGTPSRDHGAQTQTDTQLTMKLTKILTAVAFAFALTSSVFAADGKIKEGSCCDKAKKAGKECSHPCCVQAAKDGKVCAKCNG